MPRPVYAILLLFPINQAYEKARKQQDELVKSDGSEAGLMFFTQTIGNACGKAHSHSMVARLGAHTQVRKGTMGLLHGLLNSPLHFGERSYPHVA